ncbi:MAG: heparinase II/III family protein [Cyclobacteriaceae bacterium]
MKIKAYLFFYLISSLVSTAPLFAQHPSLILTREGVAEIQSELGNYPLFDQKYEQVKAKIDGIIDLPLQVPVPKDAGGGYTHERHKANYREMQQAGVLYQISGDRQYADFVRKMLMAYSALYEGLPLHPEKKNNPAGKLFWQSLNESVWLVHVAQAYDCIYDALSLKDRKHIEAKLLRPAADLLSAQNPATFNKIHNHGTWSVAAVGMTGYAMGDKDLVEKALRGLDKSGNGGFYAQLDQLFSPDGYYTEGPYYQRYALMPFILFAQSIATNQPELNIFQYRDGILYKAVNCIFQLSYGGRFFPINDAIVEKGIDSPEIIYGVDIAYANDPSNKQLLAAAAIQQEVILSQQGLLVAKTLHEKPAFTLPLPSLTIRDGKDGNQGAITILRDGNATGKAASIKYTSHGLGHGHYDKLSLIFYDQGNEILADYGAARFLNVPQKFGGRYLKENKTWANQSIAHNNLVVDQQSHFNGIYKESSQHHPELYFQDIQDDEIQVISVKEKNAYQDVDIHRTVVMINKPDFAEGLLIDIVRTEAKDGRQHTYDLPYYYKGQMIETFPKVAAYKEEIKVLGTKNGYQHLWVEGKSAFTESGTRFTFLNQNRFYSLTTSAKVPGEVYLNRIGANDPEFNLRRDPSIQFRTAAKDQLIVTLIEPHGQYDPVTETTLNSYSQLEDLRIVQATDDYSAFTFKKKGSDQRFLLVLANRADDPEVSHELSIRGNTYKWQGVYDFSEIRKE